MKPENELLAEEVAFVNTCGKMAEVLAGADRGRHQFEISIYDADGSFLKRFGTVAFASGLPESVTVGPDVEPLTLEEFDKIVRTGEAELPPMVHVSEPVAAEMQRLEEELSFEVPASGATASVEPIKVTPKRKGK